MAVTNHTASIDAIPGVPLDQTPDAVASANCVVAASQSVVVPLIAATVGNA